MTAAVSDTATGGHAPVARVVPDAGRRVLAMAAASAGASVEELLGPRRFGEIVRPRRAAMVALRRAGLAYGAIGRRMRRDHTSVLISVRRGEVLAGRDAEFAALVDRMVAAIVPAAPAEFNGG